MTFLTLVLALLADQLRAHDMRSTLLRWLDNVGGGAAREESETGAAAAVVLVLGAGLASAAVYYLLWELQPLLALLFNLLVLYLMIGFRRQGERFAEIHLALRMGEVARARALLEEWRGGSHEGSPVAELSRLAIEKLLLDGHRQVFACALWFIILPGPSGAVIYRFACVLAERARRSGRPDAFAVRLFELIDWLPVRLSALAFAVVGDFEDALYCWRTQAALWPERTSAILLASAGGALGLKLGMAMHENGKVVDRAQLGLGRDVDVDQMQAAVSLLWRALLVCLFVFALPSLVS